MQKSPSFVLLEADSSSDHEEVVTLNSDDPPIFSTENISNDTPVTYQKERSNPVLSAEASGGEKEGTKSVSKDSETSSISTDECSDISDILLGHTGKYSDSSNKSSLSPEEIIVEAPSSQEVEGLKISSDVETISDDRQQVSSEAGDMLDAEASTKPHDSSASPTAGEVESSSDNNTTVVAGGIEGVGWTSDNHADTTGATHEQTTGFFFRVVEVVGKVHEITGHIDTTSKIVALLVLLAATMIPAITICLITTSTSSTEPVCPVAEFLDNGGSQELIKCKSALNWRHEKIEQFETKLERLKASLKELQSSYSECRESLSEYHEKYSKCSAGLKDTKKQLKAKEELYENSRNKVLELQEMIISSQQDEFPDHRPFFQRAFDKMFGGSSGHRDRESRKRWRN